MKFLLSILALVIVSLIFISILTSSQERLNLEYYYKTCKELGGVVAEWSTNSGPPQTRKINRTCVDPKMILEVK